TSLDICPQSLDLAHSPPGSAKDGKRTCALAARIAAGAARAARGFPGRKSRRGVLCRDGKNGELWGQFLAVALGALRFLGAIDQGFKFVIALLADVFKDRHGSPQKSRAPRKFHLLSI